MAKILITLLGTGRKESNGYKEANYMIDGKLYENETSIARALTSYYGIEKIFMLGTSGSMWDEIYRVFGGNNDDKELELYDKKEKNCITPEDLSVVNSIMDEYTGLHGSSCFIINYGLNREELWRNFEQFLQISEYINPEDELYLDITHSFRSLAMMSFQMVQFVEQVRRKDISVKGIFYGMFEYSTQNDGVTPVVDISILTEIQEWTKAIGYLKYSGNASMFYELINANTIGTDEESRKVFMHLSNNISMGNINGIQQAVRIIKKRIDSLKTSSNPIAAYISRDIEEFVSSLDHEQEAEFSIALAKWFASVHNYAMSYMVLSDAIISKVCAVNRLNPDEPQGQEKAKGILSNFRRGQDGVLVEFAKTYYEVNDIRNSIAHSTGMRRTYTIERDINDLSSYIEKINAGFIVLKKD